MILIYQNPGLKFIFNFSWSNDCDSFYFFMFVELKLLDWTDRNDFLYYTHFTVHFRLFLLWRRFFISKICKFYYYLDCSNYIYERSYMKKIKYFFLISIFLFSNVCLLMMKLNLNYGKIISKKEHYLITFQKKLLI